VRLMEALASCEKYPANMLDQLHGHIENLRAGWEKSDERSKAWQEMLRDGCFQTTGDGLEAATSLGCEVPHVPEYAAWRARPIEPPLGTPEAECEYAGYAYEAFQACTALPAWATDMGNQTPAIIQLSLQLASLQEDLRNSSAARCRFTTETLTRVASEFGCDAVVRR